MGEMHVEQSLRWSWGAGGRSPSPGTQALVTVFLPGELFTAVFLEGDGS